jgi:hypothetical protein
MLERQALKHLQLKGQEGGLAPALLRLISTLLHSAIWYYKKSAHAALLPFAFLLLPFYFL